MHTDTAPQLRSKPQLRHEDRFLVRGPAAERREAPALAAAGRECRVALCPEGDAGGGAPGLGDAEGAVEAGFADEGVRVLQEIGLHGGEEGGEGSGVWEGEEGGAVSRAEGVGTMWMEDFLVVGDFGFAGEAGVLFLCFVVGTAIRIVVGYVHLVCEPGVPAKAWDNAFFS